MVRRAPASAGRSAEILWVQLSPAVDSGNAITAPTTVDLKTPTNPKAPADAHDSFGSCMAATIAARHRRALQVRQR